jgi:AP endonuclease 1
VRSFKKLLNQCLNRSIVRKFDKEIGLKYLRGMHLSDIKPDSNLKKGLLVRQNIGLLVLPSQTEIQTVDFCCCPRRGYLGITAFQHILKDSRTRNIPLILATRNFQQPKAIWGKEIGMLQALTTRSAIHWEVLLLVSELTTVIKEAKSKNGKKSEKELDK